MTMDELKLIFEPLAVGTLEVKNRLMWLGTGIGSGEEVDDRLRTYYVERAKGGAGLIVVTASVTPGGGRNRIPEIYDDRLIPGFRWLAQGIQNHGAKAVMQLSIFFWRRRVPQGPLEVVGPSEGINRIMGTPTVPMSVEEIHDMVQEYGEAARRSREAGFDMIEIYAGMGFLINRFISPVTNHRTDHYGGNLENRVRLLMEIIQSVKKAVGENFPLSVRFSAEELMPGGHTLKESRIVATMLESVGVHLLNVQTGWEEGSTPLAHMSVPPGAFVQHAAEIKKVVRVPVVAAYRINEPLLAEDILRSGKADIVGMSRAFLADPEFAAKARAGKLQEIRRCIACQHCLDITFAAFHTGTSEPVTCAVNPRVGREAETVLEPVLVPKKLFIIGGGPAGMQAAQTAALRGHKVTLFDQQDRLGGQLLTAVLPPNKEELGYLITTLATQVRNTGAEIKLNTRVTPELIEKEKPDAVIVAVGAVPNIPDMPGVQGKNVVSFPAVLRGEISAGERVVVVGGGLVGCETAQYLAVRGKMVTILEQLERVGHDIGMTARWVVLGNLKQLGVKLEPKSCVKEITEKGVKVQRDGTSIDFLEADTVVLATGMKPGRELEKQLKGKVKELYLVGDCVQPRRIREAILEGFEIARKI